MISQRLFEILNISPRNKAEPRIFSRFFGNVSKTLGRSRSIIPLHFPENIRKPELYFSGNKGNKKGTLAKAFRTF